jgi:hypothetical protein
MDKKLTYEDFEKMGIISKIPESEKEDYLKKHEKFYKEDLEIAEKLIEISPRWALIASYYAMHNFAKFFLAKKFNIKISGSFAHVATVEALKKFLKEEIIDKFERVSEEILALPEFLEFARRERSKSQYYSREFKEIDKKFVRSLIDEIVKLLIN